MPLLIGQLSNVRGECRHIFATCQMISRGVDEKRQDQWLVKMQKKIGKRTLFYFFVRNKTLTHTSNGINLNCTYRNIAA